MLNLQKILDTLYEAAKDEMEVMETLLCPEMREKLTEHLEENGITDVKWMHMPITRINEQNIVAKTARVPDGEKLDEYFIALYNEYGKNFHPYTFSKKVVAIGYKDGMTEEEMKALPEEVVYMIRFGVSNSSETVEDHLDSFVGEKNEEERTA